MPSDSPKRSAPIKREGEAIIVPVPPDEYGEPRLTVGIYKRLGRYVRRRKIEGHTKVKLVTNAQ